MEEDDEFFNFLFMSVDHFIQESSKLIDENKIKTEEDLVLFFKNCIKKDQNFAIALLEKNIQEIKPKIELLKKEKDEVTRKYAIKTNSIILENQNIRKKIREKRNYIDNDLKSNVKLKQFQSVSKQINYWLNEFQKTAKAINHYKNIIIEMLQTIRSEFSSLASNQLIVFNTSYENLKVIGEKFYEFKIWERKTNLHSKKENSYNQIGYYRKEMLTLEKEMDNIIFMLGNGYEDTDHYIFKIKHRVFEEETAQQIPRTQNNPRAIAKQIKSHIDAILASKDKEISDDLKLREIREANIRERIRFATQKCEATSKFHLTSPTSYHLSPNRPKKHHLRNLTWKESTRLFNLTFAEIQSLRKSRLAQTQE